MQKNSAFWDEEGAFTLTYTDWILDLELLGLGLFSDLPIINENKNK